MKKNKNKKETHFSDNYVNQEMKKPKKRFGRRKKTDQIIRIEELEELTPKTLSACIFLTEDAAGLVQRSFS